MKKLLKPFILIWTGLFFSLSLSAQYFASSQLSHPGLSTSNPEVEAPLVNVLPAEGKPIGKPFWWLGVMLDPHQVAAADLGVFIKDQSPQAQLLRVGIDLESTERSIGGILGVVIPAGDKWLGSLDLTFAGKGETNIWSFNFGGSYQLTSGPFIFAPGLNVGGGRGNIKMGKISRNTPFIQIDGKQFLGDEIQVKLREAFLSIQPEVNFYVKISDKTGLRLNVGYRRALKYKERIFLDGYADSGNTESQKARLKLSDDAISFTKNDQSTEKGGLQQFSGLKAELGITFSIGK